MSERLHELISQANGRLNPKSADGAALRAKQAQRVGRRAELAVLAVCALYRAHGVANLFKVPEAVAPVRGSFEATRGGVFQARFVDAAEPDFAGELRGGRSLRFDVKHSGAASIPRVRAGKPLLSQKQRDSLQAATKLGAHAGLVIETVQQRDGHPWPRWWWIGWPGWLEAEAAAAGAASISVELLARFGAECGLIHTTHGPAPDFLPCVDPQLAGWRRR